MSHDCKDNATLTPPAEEDAHCGYAHVLLRYGLAEGVACRHVGLLLSADRAPDAIIKVAVLQAHQSIYQAMAGSARAGHAHCPRSRTCALLRRHGHRMAIQERVCISSSLLMMSLLLVRLAWHPAPWAGTGRAMHLTCQPPLTLLHWRMQCYTQLIFVTRLHDVDLAHNLTQTYRADDMYFEALRRVRQHIADYAVTRFQVTQLYTHSIAWHVITF